MVVKNENIESCEVKMDKVLHVPQLCTNLLSISQIVNKGNEVHLKKHGCQVSNNKDKVIATGNHENNLFRVNII